MLPCSHQVGGIVAANCVAPKDDGGQVSAEAAGIIATSSPKPGVTARAGDGAASPALRAGVVATAVVVDL